VGDLNDRVDRRTAEPEPGDEPGGAARTARAGEAADDAGHRAGDRPRQQKKKPGDAARKMRAMFKG
jgi:hypothetical protein